MYPRMADEPGMVLATGCKSAVYAGLTAMAFTFGHFPYSLDFRYSRKVRPLWRLILFGNLKLVQGVNFQSWDIVPRPYRKFISKVEASEGRVDLL